MFFFIWDGEVRIILGILGVLKSQNFLLLKDIILSKDFKEIFENIELIKIENLGYFISLNKMNSTLKITKKGCFIQNLKENNIQIINYKNFDSDFNTKNYTTPSQINLSKLKKLYLFLYEF
uniref:Uncharacterized protein n=1 Tax=viral metagenome TaxID=1070528 RepID=A0A6C0AE69_9ZZZZ